jgi:hypothetical protein
VCQLLYQIPRLRFVALSFESGKTLVPEPDARDPPGVRAATAPAVQFGREDDGIDLLYGSGLVGCVPQEAPCTGVLSARQIEYEPIAPQSSSQAKSRKQCTSARKSNRHQDRPAEVHEDSDVKQREAEKKRDQSSLRSITKHDFSLIQPDELGWIVHAEPSTSGNKYCAADDLVAVVTFVFKGLARSAGRMAAAQDRNGRLVTA